jgi:phospholipid/cholesterol/gamma-HCH transport system permease protein
MDWAGITDSGLYRRLDAAQGMATLGVRSVRSAARPPFRWVPATVTEMSKACRRAMLPLILAHVIFTWGFGVLLFGQVIGSIGAVDRVPWTFFIFWVREVSTWVSMMIFAGAVGCAMTAELGARKVRGELDALAVLGVNVDRELVMPMVMAVTLSAAILGLIGLAISQIVSYITIGELGLSHGVWWTSMRGAILPTDLVALIIKTTLIGLIIGVVSTYKGISCSGGVESVGRAVNETAVLTFIAVWMVNGLFNTAFLTAFPLDTVIRG